MYRIEAACRKHSSCHDQLVKLLRKHDWRMAVINKVCRIENNFETMPAAKAAKQELQSEIFALERKNKPAHGYAIVFSNAYWVDAPITPVASNADES